MPPKGNAPPPPPRQAPAIVVDLDGDDNSAEPLDPKADKWLASTITAGDIAGVAANSVSGFLTNVAKGVRRPQAEGGRGTRRRVELYVSTDLPQQQQQQQGGTASGAAKAEAKLEEGLLLLGGGAAAAATLDSFDGAQFDDLFGGGQGGADAPSTRKSGNASAAGGSGGAADNTTTTMSNALDSGDFFDLDGDGGDSGDWDEYDLDLTEGDDAFAGSTSTKEEGASGSVVVKKDEAGSTDSPYPYPQRPSAATATPTSVKAEALAAAGAGGEFVPPPALPPGHSMRDPAYEQMLLDHQQAVANARAVRLAALRRTVNRLMAGVVRGKLADRWANDAALIGALLSPTGDAQQQMSGGGGGGGTATKGCFAAAVDTLKASMLSVSAAVGTVKPTHAPSWLTVDQDAAATCGNNPFSKALVLFMKALAAGPPQQKRDAGDVLDDDAGVNKPTVLGLAFDKKQWELRFLTESHAFSVEMFGQLVRRVQEGLGDASSPPSGSAVVGEKRPREEEGPSSTSASRAILLRHPLEYNLILLALLRHAGVPSRLAMAAENPPPPAGSETVDVDGDNEGEGDGDDGGGDGLGGSDLASIIKKLNASASASSVATPSASTSAANSTTRGASSSVGAAKKKSSAAANTNSSSGKEKANKQQQQYVPTVCSHYWVEVWDPLRQAVVSLNPIPGLTTRFGAPYTFAFCSGSSGGGGGEQGGASSSPSLPPAFAPASAAVASSCPSPSSASDYVLDVTLRYVPKFSAIFPKRIDKHCRAYRKLLWPDAFYHVKDYAEDRSYTVVGHLMGRMNALLDGTYRYEDGEEEGKSDGDAEGAAGVKAPCPSSADLLALSARLDEDDATKISMVFGGAPLADEEAEGNRASSSSTPLPPLVRPTPATAPSVGLWRSDVFGAREAAQLDKLLYAEPAPSTLAEVKYHPLYVLEKDLQRHEAIYPKDKTTIVGTIRGAFVYKRTATAALRSRDGWLREGRSLEADGTQPYRVVPPPPSRPLAPASKFYGYWQTKPFVPLPLTEKGAIPRHGNTNWYMVMGALGAIPSTLCRVTDPLGPSVARRIAIEYRQAIMGFTKKEWQGPGAGWGQRGRGGGGGGGFGGGYEARSEGIIIKAADLPKYQMALLEYTALLEEQEARRRSLRARNWWNAFAQRLVANDRMQAMFQRGNTL